GAQDDRGCADAAARAGGRALTIVEAQAISVSRQELMTDTALLGAHFGPTWSSWTVVAKAIDALPMTAAEDEFFRAHAGRQALPAAPARELWIACGRRSGKSRFAALLAVHAACFRTYLLAPGERGVVML